MVLEEWFNQHFVWTFPLFLLSLLCIINGVISVLSGWTLLARRFRTKSGFTGQKWHLRSATMRYGTRYKSCLTIGSSSDGLYLATFWLFRLWAPPLFIAWQEIRVEQRNGFFGTTYTLLLGCEEQVPLVVRAGFGERIREEAGDFWPSKALG